MITLNQFKECDLRVATIVAAARVPQSEKLLLLRLSLGTEERQILAGIAGRYTPEELIARQIIIVANLEPRMLMGHESQGMLLAADGPEGPVLLGPDTEVATGTPVK
ncbi:MAG: nucleotide-binding protein [Parcubacteria group bacterium Gr01-1014_66]|nr:MAG: nucleotide-binding protein [Parcubacteria group bacterium Gr01-1014_66]